jgi:hypothetical protein
LEWRAASVRGALLVLQSVVHHKLRLFLGIGPGATIDTAERNKSPLKFVFRVKGTLKPF